jgi:CheY-like chemotaxis protein
MDDGSSKGSEARFAAYVEALGAALGHVDRQQPMHDYCLGLLMPIARKSVEPMAAVTAPALVAAKHQSLLPRHQSLIPIIVLSIPHDERSKIRALDLGADDYVTKPLRIESC